MHNLARSAGTLEGVQAQLAEQTTGAGELQRAAGHLRTEMASAQAKLAALAHTEAALQRENAAHHARIRELSASLEESRELVQQLRAATRPARPKAAGKRASD